MGGWEEDRVEVSGVEGTEATVWWVGGWVDGYWEGRGDRGGSNEVLWAWGRWVSGEIRGWVGGLSGWVGELGGWVGGLTWVVVTCCRRCP